MHAFARFGGPAVAAVFVGTSARAQDPPVVDCNALPNPVFVEAGDTQMRMLGDLARKLRDDVEPMTLVYLPRSTCTLAENLFTAKNTTEIMRYAPSIAENPAWDGTPLQCNNVAGGTPPALGIGATFILSCSETVQGLRPADVAIFRGPVQGYGFVVPEGVLERVPGITREEAYFVFSGRGREANALPWVEEPAPAGGTPTVFLRSPTTSTLLTIAANVAPELLPASRWVGYRLEGQEDRSTVVINGVANAAGTPLEAATIGILGVELYDRERDRLDLLAYQAAGQNYAYYPDRTPGSRDKRNLRDGHYVPWGYTEYIARVDQGGQPVDAKVQRILDIVRGQSVVLLRTAPGAAAPFDLDALEIVATNGLVPECAMGVKRDFDGGDLSISESAAPCGCFFETVQDPTLKTSPPAEWSALCPACSDAAPCAEGACRRGYCEVR
jgi:hypothetical protein